MKFENGQKLLCSNNTMPYGHFTVNNSYRIEYSVRMSPNPPPEEYLIYDDCGELIPFGEGPVLQHFKSV